MKLFFYSIFAIHYLAGYSNTFTVLNTNDAGAGSLRQAMINAVNNPGADDIIFDIPGVAPHKIDLLAELPVIYFPNGKNTVIDGSSQPANGFTGNTPKIILNGQNQPFGDGIKIQASDCEVYGLQINDFPNDGIHIEVNFGDPDIYNTIIGTSGDKRNVISGCDRSGITLYGEKTHKTKIEGNRIGTDSTGNIADGNEFIGISIQGPNGGNVDIVENLIASNRYVAIEAFASDSIKILGNLIGTAANGISSLANGNGGIIFGFCTNLFVENNVIGGNEMNFEPGILAFNCENLLVIKNKIGVGIDGSTPMGNQGGILIRGSRNIRIGEAGAGNIISANDNDGVRVEESDTINLIDNIIGLSEDQNTALGNDGLGVYILNSEEIWVEKNVIGASRGDGLNIQHPGSTNSRFTILNNFIGTNQAQSADFGNGFYGIFIGGYVNGGIIGTANGSGNTIAYNVSSAISLAGVPPEHISIRRNSIYNNGYGIDLGYGGINANEGHPVPIINNVTESTVAGTAIPGDTIELFYNHTGNNTAQGKTYIGTAITDIDSNWAYIESIDQICNITATATSTVSNTSEFTPVDSFFEVTFIASDTIICEGDTVDITTITQAPEGSYGWIIVGEDEIFDTTESITVTPATTITYTIKARSSQNVCALAPITINVFSPPLISLSPDTTICAESTIQIGIEDGLGEYEWSTGATTAKIEVADAGLYTLTVSNSEAGCSTSDSIQIDTVSCVEDQFIFIPNAIALNASINNTLGIQYSGISAATLSIYDRHGKLLWTTSDLSERWDGSYNGALLPASSVVYKLIGSYNDGEEILLSGSITVLITM